jgi:methylenetetrahydrofolate dehydrogenase (NADP+)/methenyltetrahydrofolate cyclohydrolase
MAIVFDGRAYAAKKEEELKRLGRHLKLVSILIGDDPASILYVNLKRKVAEQVGAELEVRRLESEVRNEDLINEIRSLNEDTSVNGIMIQLPLPENLRSRTQEIINQIDPKKDVDGLREDSPYLHPTSKAVVQIIEESKRNSGVVCVIGATGMVGKPLVKELRRRGYEVIECNSETENLQQKTLKADIVVSATGVPNLIKANMVKDGAVVIDVGSPKGDIDFEGVSKKVSFITPVPGGVGPVTITCLLENLLDKPHNMRLTT